MSSKNGFQNDKIKLMHDFLVDFSLKRPEKVESSISVTYSRVLNNRGVGINV